MPRNGSAQRTSLCLRLQLFFFTPTLYRKSRRLVCVNASFAKQSFRTLIANGWRGEKCPDSSTAARIIMHIEPTSFKKSRYYPKQARPLKNWRQGSLECPTARYALAKDESIARRYAMESEQRRDTCACVRAHTRVSDIAQAMAVSAKALV